MARERKTYEVYEIAKVKVKPTDHFKNGRETWEIVEHTDTWEQAQRYIANKIGTYRVRHRRIKKHETVRQTKKRMGNRGRNAKAPKKAGGMQGW